MASGRKRYESEIPKSTASLNFYSWLPSYNFLVAAVLIIDEEMLIPS